MAKAVAGPFFLVTVDDVCWQNCIGCQDTTDASNGLLYNCGEDHW